MTGGRAWAPNTYCFVDHRADYGGIAKEHEVGVTAVGDGGAKCVKIVIPAAVFPIVDVWRGLTRDNLDE